MHVVVLPSESFVPTHAPLQGIFQRDQAQALSALGHEVGVVSVDADRSLGSLVRHRSLRGLIAVRPTTIAGERDGLRHTERRVLPVRYGDWRTRLRYWVQAAEGAFDAYVRRWGCPDVIHAHNAQYAAVAAHQISQRHKVPYVVTEHSSKWRYKQIFADERAVLLPALEVAGGLYTVSDALADTLQHEGLHRRAGVLPNVLSPDFEDAPFAEPPHRRGFTFVSVGGLTRGKDRGTLISAFARAFKERPDVRLRIIGDGPQRSELANLAGVLGVDGQVAFVAPMGRDTLWQELVDADGYVLSSQVETFGVALVEALAAGLPAVATDCGGPRSIIGPDDGELVPVQGWTEMADAMGRLVAAGSGDRRARRQRCVARFGRDAIGGRMIAAYEHAMAGVR